ncbi:transposable element Tcb2 transposase [Trichonephila clavipes]|nr:transposable element Tcb2 transposase [Trichonephila clavipes]
MRVWKKWTDEHRTTRKFGRGQLKVTAAHDNRYLLHVVVNDHTAFSRQLTARLSTALGVPMSASSICRRLLHQELRTRVHLYRIPLTANLRWLRLKWAHKYRAWQADWHQVVFSDESRFNLWDPDGRICVAIPVNAAFKSALSNEVLWPEIAPFLHGNPGIIFHKDNAHPHIAKTVQVFCSAQHMLLLPWPAYSPDISPIEHVWDLVGRRLAHVPCPAASKDELLLRIPAIWNSLPQADIQNLFNSMPRRIEVLIVARGGYTKY